MQFTLLSVVKLLLTTGPVFVKLPFKYWYDDLQHHLVHRTLKRYSGTNNEKTFYTAATLLILSIHPQTVRLSSVFSSCSRVPGGEGLRTSRLRHLWWKQY